MIIIIIIIIIINCPKWPGTALVEQLPVKTHKATATIEVDQICKSVKSKSNHGNSQFAWFPKYRQWKLGMAVGVKTHEQQMKTSENPPSQFHPHFSSLSPLTWMDWTWSNWTREGLPASSMLCCAGAELKNTASVGHVWWETGWPPKDWPEGTIKHTMPAPWMTMEKRMIME